MKETHEAPRSLVGDGRIEEGERHRIEREKAEKFARPLFYVVRRSASQFTTGSVVPQRTGRNDHAEGGQAHDRTLGPEKSSPRAVVNE